MTSPRIWTLSYRSSFNLISHLNLKLRQRHSGLFKRLKSLYAFKLGCKIISFFFFFMAFPGQGYEKSTYSSCIFVTHLLWFLQYWRHCFQGRHWQSFQCLNKMNYIAILQGLTSHLKTQQYQKSILKWLHCFSFAYLKRVCCLVYK